ncbi:MAG TPA: hypothetical protein VMU77_01755 [Acidimicrobiales bacterium]|nr:hypothetical protein [Acidimicrobiales bacterium]
MTEKVPDDPAVLSAIVAAVEACWPKPAPLPKGSASTSSWRFSGRWWRAPAQARRERPWVVSDG